MRYQIIRDLVGIEDEMVELIDSCDWLYEAKNKIEEIINNSSNPYDTLSIKLLDNGMEIGHVVMRPKLILK